ncbi:MAG: T9SS type A sorting domain-containing protein, partial [Bacteroidales bacterium]|nr:T9SS type A sorting domain-containing protein [Bacteroidales bacterium]
GVQQAYIITTVGVGDVAATVELNAYPNPVADRLTLSVADTDNALRYTLTDNNGRALATSEIANAITEIDMANLVPAVYFLRVDDGNVMVRTFKIVKK